MMPRVGRLPEIDEHCLKKRVDVIHAGFRNYQCTKRIYRPRQGVQNIGCRCWHPAVQRADQLNLARDNPHHKGLDAPRITGAHRRVPYHLHTGCLHGPLVKSLCAFAFAPWPLQAICRVQSHSGRWSGLGGVGVEPVACDWGDVQTRTLPNFIK